MRTFILFIAAAASAGFAYYLHSTDMADVTNVPSRQSEGIAEKPIPTEAAEAPLVQALIRYKVPFAGSSDLMARRQKLHAFVTKQGWDNYFKRNPSLLKDATSECRYLNPVEGIFVSEAIAESVVEGRTNILFVDQNIPRCFKSGSTLAFGVDNFARGKTLFDLKGEIVLNGVFDSVDVFNNEDFFNDLQMDVNDAMYLANSEIAMRARPFRLVALHISFKPDPPILHRLNIPNYVVGADSIRAGSISKIYKQSDVGIMKPILVDARDRKYVSAGNTYEGAIPVSFISSNPIQVQYRSDFPTSIIAGAKFDTSRLPASRDIPLVIFGNDENDASPLWVIRYLRLMNYRNLYYVTGGLKAMNALTEPIVF